MVLEEQMSDAAQMLPYKIESRTKFISIIIVIIYLCYLSTVAILYSSLIPQMEEAGQETVDILNTGEAGAVGSVQVINNDMGGEVRLAFIISLILFGIIDGIFAMVLWLRKVKRAHEGAVLLMTAIQIMNRPLSGLLIIQYSIWVFINPNPRMYMNLIHFIIILSSAAGLILALIIYFYLMESKTRRIAYKIRENAPI